MPGEKLALFEISLGPLCVSSSCRRSLLQHHSLQQQQQELQGKPGGKGTVLQDSHQHLPCSIPGVKPPDLAPAVPAGGCWAGFGKMGVQGSTSEPPQGEFPEVCEALLIWEPQTQQSRNGFGNPGWLFQCKHH